MDTNSLILKALLGLFLMTGLFAVFNAWLGKWGAAIAMLGISWGAFMAGLSLGGNPLWLIPVGVIACVVGGFRVAARKMPVVPMEQDCKAVSERMLGEMDRRISERKQAN